MNNLLTVKDVARILQVDTSTIRRYLMDGSLKGIKLSGTKKKGRWRIPEEEVHNFLLKGQLR
jgi:excisionase family DNA binding protein